MDRSSSEFIATVPARKNPDAARPLILVVGQKNYCTISMKINHQIWIDSNGLTGLCLAGIEGDKFRQSLDQPARLVHEFQSKSHYDAMVYYYNVRD